MKLVLLIVGMLSFNVFGSECNVYDKLSPIQKGRLEFSYYQGKPFNNGWTMAAIALTESSAGKYRLNIETKDVGLFQINSKTIFNTLGVTNYYKKIEIVQKMMYDDILNAYVANSVLEYFKKYHKGGWRKMVASYNTGFNYNSTQGKSYVNKISKNLKMLQKCMEISE